MLVVMVGLPGSGKSTYARAQFRHIVSPDDIRLDEFGVRFDPEIEDEVWARAYARTAQALARGDVVCFDATSVTLHRRARLMAIAAEARAPAVAIWVNTPPSLARERNRNRAEAVPRLAFEQLLRAFVPPSTEEGFAAVVEVLPA